MDANEQTDAMTKEDWLDLQAETARRQAVEMAAIFTPMLEPLAGNRLTKRELFAAIAMQGLLSNAGGPYQASETSGWSIVNCTQKQIAQECVDMADALLAALAKAGDPTTPKRNEAVARWHETLDGMVSGAPLYEGQPEYVKASDHDSAISALQGEVSRLREVLSDMREYVVDALNEEKQAFKGYEKFSNIPTMEDDMKRIDEILEPPTDGR